MKHPSLGLPDRDETHGFPDAADRLRAATARLGARALEIAVERDPTFRDRYDELGLRHLLRDTEAFIDRIALSVATDDPSPMSEFADQVVPLYRRRRVPMDDLVQLSEGLRAAMAPFLDGPEARPDACGNQRRDRPDALEPTDRGRCPQAQQAARIHLQGRLMTIKWVKVDPLVMNGEPFCYGTRLTVRQLLELRRNGYGLTELIKDHPELRRLGIAAAYAYAASNRDRYAEFFEPDGSLAGPGYSEDEAADLPVQYRVPGIVVKARPAA